MKARGKKVSRKPYSTPKLHQYGNIREITQAVGNTGTADGGGPPKFRTR